MSKTKMEIRSNIINDPDNAVTAFIQLQVEFLELQQKLEEKEREAVALEDALKKANLCCCDNEEKNRELKAENERLVRVVEAARKVNSKHKTVGKDFICGLEVVGLHELMEALASLQKGKEE